jgi:hypothetical protein
VIWGKIDILRLNTYYVSTEKTGCNIKKYGNIIEYVDMPASTNREEREALEDK